MKNDLAERELGEEDDAGVLLAVLLEHYPAHLTVQELMRELDWSHEFRAEDALARLLRAGLIHRHDQFAFAARPAIRAQQLGV
ncbi:MAG: hypothetical protein QOD71_789 [Thermoleophilaceae bacterium]|jgi:predicted transcriptional regulator|nr:hypothetical protein [Thermoleophilaceae bacterium]